VGVKNVRKRIYSIEQGISLTFALGVIGSIGQIVRPNLRTAKNLQSQGDRKIARAREAPPQGWAGRAPAMPAARADSTPMRGGGTAPC
jgi:hypothetical protein